MSEQIFDLIAREYIGFGPDPAGHVVGFYALDDDKKPGVQKYLTDFMAACGITITSIRVEDTYNEMQGTLTELIFGVARGHKDRVEPALQFFHTNIEAGIDWVVQEISRIDRSIMDRFASVRVETVNPVQSHLVVAFSRPFQPREVLGERIQRHLADVLIDAGFNIAGSALCRTASGKFGLGSEVTISFPHIENRIAAAVRFLDDKYGPQRNPVVAAVANNGCHS